MYITGTNEATTALPADFNRLTLHVAWEILTNETYMLNVTLGIKINLERLQYSMVMKYYLVYERVDLTYEGAFIPVPVEFVDNFIIGFTNFSSYRTLVAIHFEWNFLDMNGTHGIYMPKSIGKSPVGTVVS